MNAIIHALVIGAALVLVSVIAILIIIMFLPDYFRKKAKNHSTKTAKDPSVKRQLLEGLLIFYAFISLIAGLAEVFTNQHAFDSRDRFWFLAAMLSWAFVYNYLKRNMVFKGLFGIAQVIGGLWANWYQLRDLNHSSLAQGRTDRLFFLCAGIALLASGIKDIDESINGEHRGQGRFTSQSTESSGAPNPAEQAPATKP